MIVDRAYARTVVASRLRQLKEDFFGNPDLILHTADIVRAKNGFEALDDPELRTAFIEAVNTMMRELQYTVVACVIKKDEHLRKHDKYAADPYHYSLEVLVERFCKELGNTPDGGFICAEKRGIELDRALDHEWARIIREGTPYARAKDIDKRIVDLGLKDKHLNVAGLQLADLVVSPIGRAVIGRRTHQDWEIVKSKFRRSGSRYKGYGLVVLP